MKNVVFTTLSWSFVSTSLGQARGYGHRGNLNWALRCESCLMSALGRRYGERPILKEMAAPSNAQFIQCSMCILCFLLFIFKRSKFWLYKHFGSADCEFACKKVPVTLCATLYHTVGTLKTSLMSRFKHFKHYSAYEGLAATDRAVDSQGSDLSMA